MNKRHENKPSSRIKAIRCKLFPGCVNCTAMCERGIYKRCRERELVDDNCEILGQMHTREIPTGDASDPPSYKAT